MAVAATILAISAIPLSVGCLLQGLDGADSFDGRAKHLASTTSPVGSPEVDGFSSWGVCSPSKPRGIQDSLHRGRAVFFDVWNMVKSFKGQKAVIQRAAMEETQEKARKDLERNSEEEMVRQMVGPRGGLPALKADLIRLATLLHVLVDSKETVQKLKDKIKGPLATMKGGSPGSLVIHNKGGRIFEVQSCEKECYAIAAGDGRVAGSSTSTAQGSSATTRRLGSSTSNGRRADDIRSKGSNQSRVADGVGSDAIRGPTRNRSGLSEPEPNGSSRMVAVSESDASHAARSSLGSTSGATPCLSV